MFPLKPVTWANVNRLLAVRETFAVDVL